VAKRLVIFTSMAAAVCISGCANLAGEVSRRDDAPAWFKQRVKEIEGEGYPKFSEADMTPRPGKTPAEWAETKSDLEHAKAQVNDDPRSVDPGAVRNSTEWQAAAKARTGATSVEQ
jgi:hypothetical protein